MKRIITMILCLALCLGVLTGLTGCGTAESSSWDDALDSIYSRNSGLTIRLRENVISPEAEFIVVQYLNNSPYEEMYGEHYLIEKWEKEEWVTQWPDDGYVFLDIGYLLRDRDAGEMKYYLNIFSQPLTLGLYRIYIEGLGAYLEFLIRSDGVIPEEPNVPYANVPEGELKELTYDWQWYTWSDFHSIFNSCGWQDMGHYDNKNGLYLYLVWDRGAAVTVDFEEGYQLVAVIGDRRTGEIYQVPDLIFHLNDDVTKKDEGFLVFTEEGNYYIYLQDEKAAYEEIGK